MLEMQWSMKSYTLIEQAKEELEMLEYQHPHTYNSLKQDLKDYISELQSQIQNSSFSSSMSAATQESSSRKKGGTGGSMKKRRRICNTDAVLERAQQCLLKIHHFKTTFS